jgi:hypothetical protein
MEHQGHRINVRLHAESPEELQAMLPTALAFWKARVRWFKVFREYAASELLHQLNDVLDDGQKNPPKVTAAQLRKLLAVPFSVQFMLDENVGGVSFEINGGADRKILKENCFEVFGTLDEGIIDGDVITLG